MFKRIMVTVLLCSILTISGCTAAKAEEPQPSARAHLVQQSASVHESMADMAERLSPCVVGIATLQNGQQGIGSGVIVSDNGYILTNHHVTAQGQEVVLVFSDGRKQLAQTVWSNQALDVAIVRAEGEFPYAKMGSVENVRVGESVLAIGTPLALQFQHTVTGGIVSALNRVLGVPSGSGVSFMEELIQTDTAINPGNSGGPLLNESGEVIGIVTVRVEEAAGIGFAIPIDIAKPIVQHFLEEGEYITPHMGVYLLDKEIARYYDPENEMSTGLYVMDLDETAAAYHAGLRAGDIILSADGRPCDQLLDLKYILFSHKVGEQLELEVQHGQEVRRISVTLEAVTE